MERTEIGIGNMRIDVVDDNAVYINLNGYTYYIDDSTNEQIFKKYIEFLVLKQLDKLYLMKSLKLSNLIVHILIIII